jgi:chorismate dehydratase
MSDSPEQTTQRAMKLGVVSFLNSRPLVERLDREPGVSLSYAVPSALAGMLRGGEVDAALIPVIDLAREAGRWRRVSDACIGSDGPTMTVRVFSRVPPEQMSELHVDGDSHTSVALARLIWSRWFRRPVKITPLAFVSDPDECESVLLIGDKVVTAPVHGFDYQVDLGGAWKEWTGLPFTFAVWAAPAGADHERLARILNAARDRGVARAAQIAEEAGPARGWPVSVAHEYLTQRLKFTVTSQAREGINLYYELATQEGILPGVPQVAR